MNIQQKMTSNGIKTWEVDSKIIRKNFSWTGKNPQLLKKELEEMDKAFPYFFLTIGKQSVISESKIFCPNCGDIITFTSGKIICCSCNTTFTPYTSSVLGYIGQIPSLIGNITPGGKISDKNARVNGRPYLEELHKKLKRMPNNETKRKILTYFLYLEEKVYFAPQIYAFYPENWPRKAPRILVNKFYFDEVLFAGSNHSHSDFHAYSSSGNLLQLCNYGSWHTVTMKTALQQRIVPKIIIDLMIADLISIGHLNDVLKSLRTSLHNLYNWIGKKGQSKKFKKQYEKYVHL